MKKKMLVNCTNCKKENGFGSRVCKYCQAEILEPHNSNSEKLPPSTNIPKMIFIGIIILLVLAYLPYDRDIMSKDISFVQQDPATVSADVSNRLLSEAVEEMNKKLPRMGEDGVERLKVSVTSGGVIRHHNRITIYTKDQIDWNLAKEIIYSERLDIYCNSPDYKVFRDNKVQMETYFVDMNDEELGVIKLSGDCI